MLNCMQTVNAMTHPPVRLHGRGADLLVQSLVRSGVRSLFGVPGDTGVVFYDALLSAADQITHVLARDERHAAAMADGYARVTGGVGVVEVSSGGGTTYVVGGLGEAYASGIPLLVLTSDIHRDSRGRGALTEIDQEALFAAVSKQVLVPERAAEIPAAVSEALRVATTGRPGPVVIVIPEDVLDEEATAELPAAVDRLSVPRTRPAAPAEQVAAAARVLSAARMPAILVGGGAHFSHAYKSLAEVAERLGAAVATTIHGKGVVEDGNPWSVGVTGNNGGGALARDCLREADVVLIVGSRANATDTDSYTAPPRSATVVAVDIDPARVARNYPGALVLAGDAATVLDQVLGQMPPRDDAVVEARGDALAVRSSRGEPRAQSRAAASALQVDDVVDELARVTADLEPIVVADPGAPTPATADRWPVSRAARDIVVPRGHGPMGYAVPAAIGASVACPPRTVLALTADGSFAMSCGELETIARLDLPIVVVQFTNHSFGWIKMLQHLYQDGRYFGVDPGPIDAVAVAQACGLRAARPTTLDELRDHVRTALRDRVAVYLDVEVPHMIDVVPQVAPWHRALAGDATRPVY